LSTKALPFSVSVIGECTLGDKFYLERNNLDFYLLLYTVGGSGIITYNKEKIIIPKDSVIILDSHIHQVHRTMKDNTWHFKFVHFYTFADNSMLKLLTGTLMKSVNIKHIFAEIYAFSSENTPWADIKLSALMNDLLTDLAFENKFQNSQPSTANSAISYATDYIKSNYEIGVNISDLADYLHLSKYYFIHLFKQETGIPPYEYLTKYRIDCSKNLLLQGLKIDEIASKCGFGNSNNYNRIFKKLTGVTPNSFRKLFYNDISKPL
jgi:YesN/AraC family two-component response regulator